MVIEEIKDDSFEEKITNSMGIVILFLIPEGSGISHLVKDMLEHLHDKMNKKFHIYKIDSQKIESLLNGFYLHNKYKTTMMIFNNGSLYQKIENLDGYSELKSIIRAIMSIKTSVQV